MSVTETDMYPYVSTPREFFLAVTRSIDVMTSKTEQSHNASNINKPVPVWLRIHPRLSMTGAVDTGQ